MDYNAPSKTRTSLSPSDSGILRHFAKVMTSFSRGPVHSSARAVAVTARLSRLHGVVSQ